jgi:hypothetical protein
MNESFSKGATFTRRCHTQSYGRVFLHRDKNAQHIGLFDVSLQHHLGSPLGGWIQRSQPITVSNVKKKLRNKRKVESNNHVLKKTIRMRLNRLISCRIKIEKIRIEHARVSREVQDRPCDGLAGISIEGRNQNHIGYTAQNGKSTRV